MQFIPAIEWVEDEQGEPQLAPFSPDPENYGKFLCEVFDLWFDKHRDRISVRHFDTVLGRMVQGVAPLCILGEQCHSQLTVEHNGDLFGCDHFVERRWQLGHIGPPEAVDVTVEGDALTPPSPGRGPGEGQATGEQDRVHGDLPSPQPSPGGRGSQHPALDVDWLDQSDSNRLGEFACRKQHLPQMCLDCQWKELCHGGCPKHRPHRGDVPEPTILCASYKRFNEHAIMRLEWLANYLRSGMQPPPPGPGPERDKPLRYAKASAPRSKTKKRRKKR